MIRFGPLLLLCLGFNSCSDQLNVPGKPNIIIILADDLGYGDLASYGGSFDDTPNLDRMASEGLMFTDFHSNCPVCSPTRAALLSGKYQQKVGIEAVVYATKFRHTGINAGTYTLADYAKSQGYATGISGKWHLGYDTAFSPLNYGFDYFRGFVSGNVDYHSHIDGAGKYDWWYQKDTIIQEGYSTDLITRNALSFIGDHKEEPFLLYVAHEAPHFPYQGRKDPPQRTSDGLRKEERNPEELHGVYREMVSVMDEGIGSIFTKLEETGLDEKTFVFFMSDNGAGKNGSNAHLRGYKGSLWEGGHRVPALACWKGRVEPGTSDEFLLGMDLFPTIVSLMGQDPPDGIELDGLDFSSVLLNGESLPERTAFWRYGDAKSVRNGPWKLLVQKDGSFLFNLYDDPGEKNNLYREEAAKADSLMDVLLDWEEEMDRYELNTYL